MRGNHSGAISLDEMGSHWHERLATNGTIMRYDHDTEGALPMKPAVDPRPDRLWYELELVAGEFFPLLIALNIVRLGPAWSWLALPFVGGACWWLFSRRRAYLQALSACSPP